jgi:hypothetical protein
MPVSGERVHTRPMREPRRFAALRANYRSQRDAHVLIAGLNRGLARDGKQPTNAQRVAEQRAAEATKRARIKLHAAIRLADTPYSATGEGGLTALVSRYKAAFDAYHAIVTHRVKRALAGDPPCIDGLVREQEAREALATAKSNLERLGPRV